MGRPPLHKSGTVGVHLKMPTETIKRIKAWALKQKGKPNLSQSIRRLVEMGMEKEKK